MKSSPKWEYYDDLDGWGESGYLINIGNIKTVLSKDPLMGWSFNMYSHKPNWQITGSSNLSAEKTKYRLEMVMLHAVLLLVINDGELDFTRLQSF